MMQKRCELLKPWHMGTHLRELHESYLMIVLSNRAATYNYKLGTFKFHECRGKINMEEKFSHFFMIFYNQFFQNHCKKNEKKMHFSTSRYHHYEQYQS